ncbi:hypothetical protein BDY17DRAFT_170839 [Neohortaea acidophila]|uniref:Uncharacterized protein n=1 Tax=Neohortaea acidophila TaxID=245834 RepID=A0A6A6PQ13_9PEZI|nr:uncharacterized protein BDY17DRAFT_170839 [Neohortaea acidophila]KAF2481761.1 hypothetical protein BDY17DRAFT_170839 [Neohortaea acidophila]
MRTRSTLPPTPTWRVPTARLSTPMSRLSTPSKLMERRTWTRSTRNTATPSSTMAKAATATRSRTAVSCFHLLFRVWECMLTTSTDMSAYLDRCADSTIPGRSVRILCDDTRTTVTGVMPKPTHSSTYSTVWVTQEIDVIETTHTHRTATDDKSSTATVTHHVDVSGTHAHRTRSATDTAMPTITLVPKGRDGVVDDAADS